MDTSRRNFLKATAGIAAVGAISGYKDMLSLAATFRDQGERAADPVYGNALQPEYTVSEDGKVNLDSGFKLVNTMCNGCTTHCGVRVKIDKASGKVVRVTGNPYNPLSSHPWLEFNTDIKESFAWTAGGGDKKTNRSTVCARGNSVFDKIHDPYRVLTPLKRVGKRGENKWQPISLEQAIKEIVEGGDLFGEGHVDGLAAIRDTTTLIDPDNPDYGPKSQQLGCIGAVDDGRQNFVVQRFLMAFGSKNMANHTSICGLSMRAGSAAFLGDFEKYPHLKPDFDECEFLINWGTAPGQAGNPFKLMGKLLANSRAEKKLRYVTITPILTNSDTIATDRSTWIPIKPQGDLALAMGMIRWIIENKRYNEAYLSIPSAEAMKQYKEGSFTNASHLVVVEKGHPLEGKFLFKEVPPVKEGEEPGKIFYCIEHKTGELALVTETSKARLSVDQRVTIDGQSIAVKSSFKLLEEAAMQKTLHEYSEISGVPLKDLVWLADEFTSHGRKVGIHCHGGTMHTTGFYTTYAILTLTALVGAVGYKGGMSTGGGKFADWQGPRYDLFAYPDKPKISGIRLDRTRSPYEKSSEYKRKKAQGKPYPAEDQWYPFTNSVETEFLNASINGYPYRLKALLLYNASFIYGTSGAKFLAEKLKDPKASIPLIISVDPFINETSQLADYIIPDSVMYETWGVLGPWHGTLTKASVIRYPVVEPRTAKTANGEPICLDSFLIELGKALKLPGFGDKAIKGTDGKLYPLHRPEDVYLRVFENIAMDGTPVPDISDEELEICGLNEWRVRLQNVCSENWRKVAYIMARGGRYESKSKAYDGELLAKRYPKAIQIYNETVGTTRNALTGERYSGVPLYYESRLTDGTPLAHVADPAQYPFLAFSYKSHVVSAASASSEQIREIRYTNYVDINTETGNKLGLKDGDIIRLRSPHGTLTGVCRLRQGIHPQAVGVEHGFGRFGEGAADVVVGDQVMKLSKSRASGTWINQLGMFDPSRKGRQPLADFACGSNARQAVPVTIEKVKA
ncbi:molybdopterin-dependent oxidoreductase [Sporolituus thermophilus]|uniref:molybdopterin-dependent oxidoreductase n=1 Tax=Sporolituus thermophilus TaxID=608505 RepID=UPI000B812115|nr:molybdopterin-dependent oxidoreductase [Sporolituus thermophilus]